jgi:uncharacterized protein
LPPGDDDALRDLLRRVRSIAVLGIKTGSGDDAHRVPLYLQAAGYRVWGVNPKLPRALGEPCVATLAELAEPPDLIDVFRAARHLSGHVDEILALPRRPLGVWLQLGIRDDAAASRLEREGIQVVQDRCIMVDHRRLLGAA